MILALLLLIASPALAGELAVPCLVTRIVDADTIDCLAHPWPGLTIKARVRLLGVDTPEKYGPLCEAERDRARLAEAFVASHIGGTVTLVDVQPKFDSFGRALARIVTESGEDLGPLLMAAGLAHVETKGHGEWCR